MLDEWPLSDLKTVMECREDFTGGETAGLPSVACAAYDTDALYIAVRNPLRQPDKIVMTGSWGTRDGVELAFQTVPESGAATPILNLYGYPDGTIESLTIAGATAAQAEKLRQGVTYAARRTDKGWDCEWRIPWSAAGIDPARVKKLRFNLGVRKMENKAWVVWRGTGGYNFDVAKAGSLLLAP